MPEMSCAGGVRQRFRTAFEAAAGAPRMVREAICRFMWRRPGSGRFGRLGYVSDGFASARFGQVSRRVSAGRRPRFRAPRGKYSTRRAIRDNLGPRPAAPCRDRMGRVRSPVASYAVRHEAARAVWSSRKRTRSRPPTMRGTSVPRTCDVRYSSAWRPARVRSPSSNAMAASIRPLATSVFQAMMTLSTRPGWGRPAGLGGLFVNG